MSGVGNISSEAVFETLRVLCRIDRPVGVADLHRITGEPTSSVHRAIATLEEAGYAGRYQGASRFAPGRMCHHLVRALINRYALRKTARPYLMRIVDLADGPATLNARLGWYSIRLSSLDGRAEYQEGRRLGETRLLHLDAAPLTILSHLRERERDAYARFAAARLGVTPGALAIPALVREARSGPYVRRPDPSRPGYAWIGFPLGDPNGRIVAAIAASIRDPGDGDAGAAALAREIAATVSLLQQELGADKAKSAAPFESVDPDAIILGEDAA